MQLYVSRRLNLREPSDDIIDKIIKEISSKNLRE